MVNGDSRSLHSTESLNLDISCLEPLEAEFNPELSLSKLHPSSPTIMLRLTNLGADAWIFQQTSELQTTLFFEATDLFWLRPFRGSVETQSLQTATLNSVKCCPW